MKLLFLITLTPAWSTTLTRAGHHLTEDIIITVNKALKDLAEEISNKLAMNVYSDSDKEFVALIKSVLDLKHLAQRVALRGVPLITGLKSITFVKNCKKIAPNISAVRDVELKSQYKIFLTRINSVWDSLAGNVTDEDIITSMKLLEMLLSSTTKHYLGCELIMHALCVAACSMSVESIIESFVSVHEIRMHSKRHVDEVRGVNELMIGLNGPTIGKCNPIVNAAMDAYWNKHHSSTDTRHSWF